MTLIDVCDVVAARHVPRDRPAFPALGYANSYNAINLVPAGAGIIY